MKADATKERRALNRYKNLLWRIGTDSFRANKESNSVLVLEIMESSRTSYKPGSSFRSFQFVGRTSVLEPFGLLEIQYPWRTKSLLNSDSGIWRGEGGNISVSCLASDLWTKPWGHEGFFHGIGGTLEWFTTMSVLSHEELLRTSKYNCLVDHNSIVEDM